MKEQNENEKVNEQWRIHQNFPKYLVSNQGRVMSLACKQPKMLTIHEDWQGYRFVSVENKKGDRKHYRLHNLIAECYIAERKPGMEINHKNFKKADNSIENLEWMTHRENVKHAHQQRRAHYKLTIRDEKQIIFLYQEKGLTLTEVSQFFDVSISCIWNFIHVRFPRLNVTQVSMN